jgi:hypothetical protein
VSRVNRRSETAHNATVAWESDGTLAGTHLIGPGASPPTLPGDYNQNHIASDATDGSSVEASDTAFEMFNPTLIGCRHFEGLCYGV